MTHKAYYCLVKTFGENQCINFLKYEIYIVHLFAFTEISYYLKKHLIKKKGEKGDPQYNSKSAKSSLPEKKVG